MTTPSATAAAIEAANAEAVRRMLAAEPVLIDVAAAGTVIDGLGERTILHAGRRSHGGR